MVCSPTLTPAATGVNPSQWCMSPEHPPLLYLPTPNNPSPFSSKSRCRSPLDELAAAGQAGTASR